MSEGRGSHDLRPSINLMLDDDIIKLANKNFNNRPPRKTSWLKQISTEERTSLLEKIEWEEDAAEQCTESVNEKRPYRLSDGKPSSYSPKQGSTWRTKPLSWSSLSPVSSGVGLVAAGSRYDTESYFIDSFTVTRSEYERFQNLTEGVSEHSVKLLKQIVASSLSQPDGDPWVPIPWESIRKHARDASWKELLECGLIDQPTGYSIVESQCREYKPSSWFVDEVFRGFSAASIESYTYEPKVNLITGTAVRLGRSKLYDDNRNREPEPIYSAVRVIESNGCFFDRESMEEYLRTTEGSRSYDNDCVCYRSVFDRKPQERDGFWWYSPAYSVAKTGRIFHIRGGLQSCSAGMKSAAFSNIPQIYNYDLRGSQIAAAIIEFEIAGLEPSWLIDYLADPGAKTVYASAVGVSEKCWKQLLLALIMGASIPANTRNFGRKRSKILKNLAKEFDGDESSMGVALKRFRGVAGPIAHDLNAWHRWLLETHIEQIKEHAKKGFYIKNRCGKLLWLADLRKKPIWKQVPDLTAFLLQGRESAYIHHLTILGQKYDYLVTANEHDGLITRGEIPDLARDEAKRLSGFVYAELDEKPWKPNTIIKMS